MPDPYAIALIFIITHSVAMAGGALIGYNVAWREALLKEDQADD